MHCRCFSEIQILVLKVLGLDVLLKYCHQDCRKQLESGKAMARCLKNLNTGGFCLDTYLIVSKGSSCYGGLGHAPQENFES